MLTIQATILKVVPEIRVLFVRQISKCVRMAEMLLGTLLGINLRGLSYTLMAFDDVASRQENSQCHEEKIEEHV